jgi:GNAT superfamily N-acetyltransferase
MAVHVRPLTLEDRPAWDPLWQGYLAFYRVTLSAEATDATWARFHDPAEPLRGLGAVVDGRLVGLAHLVFHHSTWSVASRCYLNDLFAADEVRGRGVGRALIEASYAEARAAGAETVWWLTHEANATARALYERVAKRTGFIQYRQDV